MATTTDTPTIQLEVRRVFAAPPEQVFDAWTTPEELKRFHAPGSLTCTVAEVDARVGGRLRIVMQKADGTEHRATGIYRTVDRPRTLSLTWRWDHDPLETLITIEFRPKGTGTELVFTHVGFDTVESRDSHRSGWTGILDKLSSVT